MLDLLPREKLGDNAGQSLVLDPKKVRIFWNGIMVKSYANNSGDSSLVLYTRINLAGRFEAGVIFWPGLEYENCEKFPMEMIRIFSLDEEDCLKIAEQYYFGLVEKQCFKCQN